MRVLSLTSANSTGMLIFSLATGFEHIILFKGSAPAPRRVTAMADYSGKFIFILIVAVLLSSIAAWVIAWRYRRAMQALMRAPGAQAGGEAAAAPPEALPAPRAVSLADNRRAGRQLALLLIALSFLLALSSAAIYMLLSFPDEPFSFKRAAVVALLYLWPAIPALGLMWRWSRWRVIGALVLWCVACFPVFLWRSIEPKPLQLLLWMAIEIGPSMVLVSLVLLGNATRAVAPWLLLPFIGLAWASIAGTDVLTVMMETRSPLLEWLVGWLPAYATIALFVLLPWLLAWWPLRWLGRALGRAYARKWLSDLLVVFTTVWAMTLATQALSVGSSVGAAGVAMLLPLLWIPLVMVPCSRLRPRAGRPPTLLVLRVYQRDAQVQALFDHVVERWRLSGNTVMIAGTDLATRTLGADDIFPFLDGGLAARFVRTPAEVAPRLAAFDMAPDMDGRYRVNECYCHDATWQDALRALVSRSDVVLMDLRGFQAHNAGCRFELETLAQAPGISRVIVLADAQTDRAVAAQAIGHGQPERFTWLDAARIDARKHREVLASLFAATAG